MYQKVLALTAAGFSLPIVICLTGQKNLSGTRFCFDVGSRRYEVRLCKNKYHCIQNFFIIAVPESQTSYFRPQASWLWTNSSFQQGNTGPRLLTQSLDNRILL